MIEPINQFCKIVDIEDDGHRLVVVEHEGSLYNAGNKERVIEHHVSLTKEVPKVGIGAEIVTEIGDKWKVVQVWENDKFCYKQTYEPDIF